MSIDISILNNNLSDQIDNKLEKNIDDNLDHLIGSYRNNLTIDNFIKLIIHDLGSDFIIASWKLSDSHWFIPGKYDSNLSENIDLTGWYIHEEPTLYNIPFLHTKIIHNNKHNTSNIYCIQSKNIKLFYGYLNKNASNMHKFLLEVYLEKLASNDLLRRQKNKQETIISNIIRIVKPPLNEILHITNTITTELENTYNKQLKQLNKSAVDLANNIFDIIDISKLEIGSLVLNKDILNIKELVETTISLVRNINENSNIIDYYIDPSVPIFIYSDAKRIKQILIIILKNAIQHTHKGSIYLHVVSTIVNISSEDCERESIIEFRKDICNIQHSIRFTIHDTGTGISDNIKNNLFKPLDTSYDKQTGFSLRMSYMLANLLGGRLTLLNSILDKGSVFEFNLIACEEQHPIIISEHFKKFKDKSILLLDVTNDHLGLCKFFDYYKIKYVIATSYKEITVLHTDKTFDLVIIKSINQLELFINLLKPLFNTVYLSIGEYSNHCDFYILSSLNNDIFRNKLSEIFNKLKYKTPNILIVDNDLTNRIILEKNLRQIGYNIDLANTNDIALNMITANLSKYNLYIITINEDNVGFELANAIHRLIPHAIMLGIISYNIPDDYITNWFDAFIKKPIDVTILDKKIREKLEKKF